MMTAPEINPKGAPWRGRVSPSSICCLRRHSLPSVLTLSLSDLRQDPHSELVEFGRGGHSTQCGRCFLGEPLTAGRSIFAAQSNLAFLGMWITSNRPDLASFLPFDADTGSSSNMASSQPGRRMGLQSWAERSKNTFVAARRISRSKKPRTSE